METFQQSNLKILWVRERVLQMLVGGALNPVEGGPWTDEAVDLCGTVGADHFVGLRHLHSCRQKKETGSCTGSTLNWRSDISCKK